MQQTWIRTLLVSALVAGGLAVQTAPSSALPVLKPGTMSTEATPNIEKTWYRCGYYRCHRRYYSYYRPYHYYYGGYYYHPHIGVRLGGIGLGFY